MNRKTIEKAAKDYAYKTWAGGGFECASEDSFIAGAEWRINSVWHTDVKAGNTRRAILVRFKNRLFNVFEDIRDLKGIEDMVEMFAYLDDFLPDRKEESK